MTIESRFLTYNKADVERILGSVENIDDTPTPESDNAVKSGGVDAAIKNAIENIPVSSEERVRNIVTGYLEDAEPESETDAAE